MADEVPEMTLAEMGPALAAEMGIESPAPEKDDPRVAEIFNEPKEAPKEAPTEAAPEPKKWTHEPTGKEFDSELDLLRYESGWKTQQFGEKLKALEERVQPQEPKQEPVTRDGIKKTFFPNLSQEDLADPLVDIVTDGLLNLGEAQYKVFDKRLQELSGKFEEMQARSASGIDQTKEQQILQEYPELKALPLRDRLSVLKRLGTQAEAKAQKPVPQPPRAGEYVEGSSVRNEVPTSHDATDAFDKLGSPEEELKVLGSAFVRAGLMNI